VKVLKKGLIIGVVSEEAAEEKYSCDENCE